MHGSLRRPDGWTLGAPITTRLAIWGRATYRQRWDHDSGLGFAAGMRCRPGQPISTGEREPAMPDRSTEGSHRS